MATSIGKLLRLGGERALLFSAVLATLVCLVMMVVIAGSFPFNLKTTEQKRIEATVTEEKQRIAALRVCLNQGSNAVRDYVLSRDARRELNLGERLSAARLRASEVLRQIGSGYHAPASFASELGKAVADYWAVLDQPRTWSEADFDRLAALFFTEVVQPARGPIGGLLKAEENRLDAAATDLSNRSAAVNEEAFRVLFWLACAATTLGILSTWLGIRTSRHLLRDGELKLQDADRGRMDFERLSNRLVAIQEEERRRLSRELHDGIGQILTALRMEISHVRSRCEVPSLTQSLERARSLAEEAVAMARDISLLLRPPLLDDLGLEPSLRWQTEDFERRTGTCCTFSSETIAEPLSDAINTCVYRFVQEGLNNCQKHAFASHVQVRLLQTDSKVEAVVQDDGYGFDIAEMEYAMERSGLGLLGMRERISMLNGSLTVESSRGRGTTLRMQVPLSNSIHSALIDSNGKHAGAYSSRG